MWAYDLCVCGAAGDAGPACELARRIRSYKMPGNVKAADPALDYRRLFVDTSESAFTGDTAALLDSCRYLLVICSPRTKASAPVLARLNHFEAARGKTNCIAVIVGGEPVDVFPPAFIEQKLVPHILPDGTTEERLETIEPVASDLRGGNARQTRRLFHYETVRIVASIMGMQPDALEQRHNRRTRRRITAVAAVLSAIFLTTGTIFSWFGARAAHEGSIAERQTEESLAAARRIMEELPVTFADDPQALAYIRDIVLDAVGALYRAGSVNLEKIPAVEALAISEEDSADTLLKKASVLRLMDNNDAAQAAYRAGAECLMENSEDREAFLAICALLSAGDYPYCVYVSRAAPPLRRGDLILSADGTVFWSVAEWTRLQEACIPGEQVNLTLLRRDEATGSFSELTVPADLARLGNISALGV